MTGRDKHTSLLQRTMKCSRKKFYHLGPGKKIRELERVFTSNLSKAKRCNPRPPMTRRLLWRQDNHPSDTLLCDGKSNIMFEEMSFESVSFF